MIKVLIICKRLENAKKLINGVTSRIDSLKLVGIYESLEEAKKMIITTQTELIVSTDIEIIDFIKEEFITYRPGIAIITNLIRVDKSYPRLLVLNSSDSMKTIHDKIYFFMETAIEQSQKERVVAILQKFGLSFNLSGTLYLQDSILYAYSHRGSYNFEKLQRDIYSYIAEVNNTTSYRVKWSIERAIRYMFKKQTKESYAFIEKILNIEYPELPKPKQIINIVANSLDSIKL